jgi:hypothetical protein
MFAYSPYKLNRTAARTIETGVAAVFFAIFLLVAAPDTRASGVTLAWNPSTGPNVAGYHLYQGVASLTYTNEIDVGNVTNATVSGLTQGVTYYFAVSAYTAAGVESALTTEVSYTPPVSTTNSSPPVIALTAPANGTGYTAPANMALAATVTPNGHTITSVKFYSGATLLSQSSAAPYTFTWSSVPAGNYNLSATAVYDAGSTVGSSSVSVSVTNAPSPSPTQGPLPAPWQAVDIGSGSATGKSVVSNGVFVVSGAGIINGSYDSFRYVCQPLSGDGQITAQLSSVQNTGANGCAGVMIRESLASGSRYALMSLSTSDTFLWQRRNKTNFKTGATTGGSGTPPQVWVRVVRSGSSFTGYESSDAVNWTQVSSTSISMASNIYIGLAVSSGSAGVLDTSSFSNLNVVP